MKVTKSDRKSRGMDLDAITELLNKAPVGRVATVSPDSTPYIVPVNFAFDGDRIYFHCALEGMKLDCIRANPKVGFEADELLEVYASADRPCFCGSYYRSVIARGKAAIVTDREKKLQALWLLVEKYAGKCYGEMPADIVERTCVVEIVIDEISGKTHLPDKN
ncbi:MAG: Pyridoxamine 5'-phosphate oxidase [Methanocella sp. PtaU1.Bin125]|nr:MAG: Pyridoxamine 5'-phosphate oxidase [Methanocella sp. PtaU1.Bin125]